MEEWPRRGLSRSLDLYQPDERRLVLFIERDVDRVGDRGRRRGRGCGEHEKQRQSERRDRGTRHRYGAFSGLGAEVPFGARSGEGAAPCDTHAGDVTAAVLLAEPEAPEPAVHAVPAVGADTLCTFETYDVRPTAVCCCTCDLVVDLAIRVSGCARTCVTAGWVEAERGGRNQVRTVQGATCNLDASAPPAFLPVDPGSCVARTAVKVVALRTTPARATPARNRDGCALP